MPVVIVWSCQVCGCRMRTLFPKKQPAGAVSKKRVAVPVRCAACGSPRDIEIPDTQSIEGATTKADQDR